MVVSLKLKKKFQHKGNNILFKIRKKIPKKKKFNNTKLINFLYSNLYNPGEINIIK